MGSRYPYDRPRPGLPTATPSTATSSGPAQHLRPHHRPGMHQWFAEFVEHMKAMRAARQIWEVAVRRNALTTSLALLGGVLVADTLLFPQTHKASMLQTNLAAKQQVSRASNNRNGSSTGATSSSNSGSSSSSSSSSEHRHVPSAAVVPAHA